MKVKNVFIGYSGVFIGILYLINFVRILRRNEILIGVSMSLMVLLISVLLILAQKILLRQPSSKNKFICKNTLYVYVFFLTGVFFSSNIIFIAKDIFLALGILLLAIGSLIYFYGLIRSFFIFDNVA